MSIYINIHIHLYYIIDTSYPPQPQNRKDSWKLGDTVSITYINAKENLDTTGNTSTLKRKDKKSGNTFPNFLPGIPPRKL